MKAEMTSRERFSNALETVGRVDENEHGISNDRISEIAKMKNVPALELIGRYREKQTPKND